MDKFIDTASVGLSLALTAVFVVLMSPIFVFIALPCWLLGKLAQRMGIDY
jgi:hypothetical protein